MFKGFYTVCTVTLIVFFSSCKPSETSLPPATGRPGSLVIVSDEGVHTALKPTYDTLFLKPRLTGGSEPFLELHKPAVKDFMQFFFNQRIVLALVTEESVDEMDELLSVFKKEQINAFINDAKPALQVKQDVFAKDQHIVYLFGKNAADIQKKMLLLKWEDFVGKLVEYELKGQNRQLFAQGSANEKYYAQMKSDFGIGVHIPEQFKWKKTIGGAYLFQMDTVENNEEKTIGLIVHAYPSCEGCLTYDSIRAARDSVSKYLVLGQIKGTYMSTSESSSYPSATVEPLSIGPYSGLKVKGWWTVKGIMMAGPYVRYVVHVPAKKLIFAFEGFVYKHDLNFKEPDLRLIESIALGIQ
jgi:hypothetical protein